MQSSSGSCCDCLRSLVPLFWEGAGPGWLFGFRLEPLASWLPFKGWFSERNSALLRTLFLSLALDRLWEAGIAVSGAEACSRKPNRGEKSLFPLPIHSPLPSLKKDEFGQLQKAPSHAVSPSTDCSC